MQAFAQKVFRVQKSRSGVRRTHIENRHQLREVAESAPSSSMIDGPEGLGAILKSGRFRVTGSVYFRPLQPFQPDPTIPSEGANELYARMDVGGQDGFAYPNDGQ